MTPSEQAAYDRGVAEERARILKEVADLRDSLDHSVTIEMQYMALHSLAMTGSVDMDFNSKVPA